MMPSVDPLTPALRSVLEEIGGKLEHGNPVEPDLLSALDLFATLPPSDVGRLDGEIARAAKLWRRPPARGGFGLFRRGLSSEEQLLRSPGLERLFIFHRDGRLREAALNRITGGVANAFMFAAIMWRLNDWAQPVRDAAARCAARCFPATDPGIVAAAAMKLLPRLQTWMRWSSERELIDHACDRDDVVEQIIEVFRHARTGPSATVLRHLLRRDTVDKFLGDIASKAAQPAVRATALQAMIENTAEWPSGFEWRWIDKSMGHRRRVVVFSRRLLSVDWDRTQTIELGMLDRSALVRRVAMTGVLRHMSGTPEARAYAQQVQGDRSRSLREKAAFLLRD